MKRIRVYIFAAATAGSLLAQSHHAELDVNSRPNPLEALERRAREIKIERPAGVGISIARLEHKVPKAARKEFERGAKSIREAKSSDAIRHLLKALELDSGYFDARFQLGNQYFATGNHNSSLREFDRTLEIDSSFVPAHINRAFVLLYLHRAQDAEASARRAVRLAPDNQAALYILGLALASRSPKSEEAAACLRGATGMFPRARLAMAEVLSLRGEVQAARDALRAYLDAGHVEQRELVENWLASLHQ